jgi:hypothetical protein
MPFSFDRTVDRPAVNAADVRGRCALSCVLALAMVIACNDVARAQGISADSGAAWVAASIGYAGPGSASIGEAWLRPAGWLVVGGQISNAQRGGFDSDKSTDVYSIVAGVRAPAGPFRLTLAAGRGEATSNRTDALSGSKAVWTAAVDWPVWTHVAWHASRFAVIGGQRPYVLTTVGLAIGGVR